VSQECFCFHLQALASCRRLTALTFTFHTNLSNTGLAAAARLPWLQLLDLKQFGRRHRYTAAGAAALWRALPPGCKLCLPVKSDIRLARCHSSEVRCDHVCVLSPTISPCCAEAVQTDSRINHLACSTCALFSTSLQVCQCIPLPHRRRAWRSWRRGRLATCQRTIHSGRRLG